MIGSIHTTPSLRAGLEAAAALLAATVGLIALVRYRSRRDVPYLFIGLGFLGVALFDANNAVTSTDHFSGGVDRLTASTQWSWLVGRLYLALLLVLGGVALQWPRLGLSRGQETLVATGATAVALGALWAIIAADPGPPVRLDGPLERPLELVPGVLFLLATAGYARRRAWRQDAFLLWLIFPLALLAATQFFLAFADAPSALLFSAALAAKLAAYALAMFGVVASLAELFRSAERGRADLAQMNARLTHAMERQAEVEHQLAAQKAQLELVLNSMTEGVAFLGADGRVISANASVRAILGREIEKGGPEAYYSRAQVFHGDRTTPMAVEELPAVRAGRGEIVRDQLMWVVNDVRPEGFYIRANATPVHSEDGVDGAVLVFRDCTKEELANEALRERQSKLDALVKTATDAIVSIDEDSVVTEFNPAAQALFGWKEEEIVGQSVTRLMPAEYHDPHLEGVQRFLETGKGPIIGRAIELTALHKDGERVPIEISVSPWQAGDEMGFTAIIRDIRARKEAEKRLLESEARYRVLAENATDLITETEADGIVRYASPAAFSVTGRTAEMLVGRRIQDFLEPEDQAVFARMLRRLAKTDQTQMGTLRMRRPDGDLVYLETILRWIPPTGKDDEPLLLGTYRNVTDKVRDREALARSNEELQEFAFIASHDLKEPIRKIIAFGDRIATDHADALGPRGADYLARMRGAAERMRILLDDLLAYSRVTTKARPFEPIDLVPLVEDVLEDLGEQIRETGGQVTVGRLPRIEGDPTQLRQLFQNLISNALKYHQEDVAPRVRIHGRDRTNEHEITVEDNGIGFEMRYAERIFRPFQRLHGRTEYHGSGMGLAIVRKIVERHGGEVTVESEPGKGSSFTITLPVHVLEPDEETAVLEAKNA